MKPAAQSASSPTISAGIPMASSAISASSDAVAMAAVKPRITSPGRFAPQPRLTDRFRGDDGGVVREVPPISSRASRGPVVAAAIRVALCLPTCDAQHFAGSSRCASSGAWLK